MSKTLPVAKCSELKEEAGCVQSVQVFQKRLAKAHRIPMFWPVVPLFVQLLPGGIQITAQNT